ncbi:universal stress protein UspE [Pseudoalteromonas denitrificans]|uniref:Universal stress protein E n=1 Tax=Pseudoalteromonas denitrificans DSM 6059 TaxID=1123010 RepID=A0A1I1PGX1_9GAMM|nr:universal stress protein UspE [Pseudoalteromonas denitrificans]SFD06273.1 universal stress protein E [Pseudoalteromonas denitrificans DSM 6059]
MNTIKKILAVVDPSKTEQTALKRSFELAQKSGAKITAFLTIYDFSYEMTTMLSLDEREAMRNAVIDDRKVWIKSIIEPFQNELEIDCKIIWHNRPFESIITSVLKDNYDIVLKATHEHATLKSVIFTPTDWHLIRKCPCPVLLIKEHQWPANGNVLAAVNACADDKQHLALNQRIMSDAKFISNLIDGNLHLVNSFPGTPVNIAIEIPEFDPTAFNETVKKHHVENCHALANEFDVCTDNCHIKEGLPEDVIPIVAEELDAELIVIGTIGRTGFSAALIGNTAEHVIDSLNCDVLALKPDGYKSPLDK